MSGGPKAAANVALTHPTTGEVRVFEVGHVFPQWALAMITNPDVIDDSEPKAADPDDGPPPVADEPKPKRATRTRRTAAKPAAK